MTKMPECYFYSKFGKFHIEVTELKSGYGAYIIIPVVIPAQ